MCVREACGGLWTCSDFALYRYSIIPSPAMWPLFHYVTFTARDVEMFQWSANFRLPNVCVEVNPSRAFLCTHPRVETSSSFFFLLFFFSVMYYMWTCAYSAVARKKILKGETWTNEVRGPLRNSASFFVVGWGDDALCFTRRAGNAVATITFIIKAKDFPSKVSVFFSGL